MKHKLIVVSIALMIALCSTGDTTSTRSAEAAEKQISQNNPKFLEDIPESQTTISKLDRNL